MGEPITTPNTAGDALAHGCRRPSVPPTSAGGGSFRDPPNDLGGGAANRAPAAIIDLAEYRVQKAGRSSPEPRLLVNYRNCSTDLEHLDRQIEKLLLRAAYLLGRST